MSPERKARAKLLRHCTKTRVQMRAALRKAMLPPLPVPPLWSTPVLYV